jgi:hypothetical protein
LQQRTGKKPPKRVPIRTRPGRYELDTSDIEKMILKAIESGIHHPGDIRNSLKMEYGYAWRKALLKVSNSGKIKRIGKGSGLRYFLIGQDDIKPVKPKHRLSSYVDKELQTKIIACINGGVNRAQTIRARLRVPYNAWRASVDDLLNRNAIRRVGWATGVNYYVD